MIIICTKMCTDVSVSCCGCYQYNLKISLEFLHIFTTKNKNTKFSLQEKVLFFAFNLSFHSDKCMT